MNNLYQQLNQNQQNSQKSFIPNQKNDLLKQLLNNSNPSELLNSLISNNPKLQGVMNLMQSSKMTPKDFFYFYAKQKGINPDQFLSSLK